MKLRDFLAILAALISIVSVIPYLIDVVKRKTKPNIVSWFTWTLLTAIGTAAAFAAHEPRTALITLAATICTVLVLTLGIKYGIAKFSLFDGICQLGAVVGLVLWLVFDSPTIAIIATVTIDFVAALPTLRHSYINPEEETWQTFFIGAIAPAITIVSLSTYSINSLLYPIYLTVANGMIAAVIVSRRRALGLTLSRSSNP